jgi:mRNA-degrading endonuclease toxin of MazEF toxin-antitoxin module
MSKAPTPKRGEIWLVDFDPAIGAEIRKARPAVGTITPTQLDEISEAIALCVGTP